MDPIDSIKQSTLPIVWKHLSYADLITFGQTSKEYNLILENPETWLHLLKRDFNVEADPEEAKDYYELLHLIIPDYQYIEEPADLICPTCGSYTGAKRLKYQGVCLDCRYIRPDNRFAVPNNDEMVLNRLRKIALEQPSDPQTCSVSTVDERMPEVIAMINGTNIYEIIIKVVINIDLMRFKKAQNGDYGLTAYIRQMLFDSYEEGGGFGIKSFLDVLGTLKSDWVNSYDVFMYVIQRVDNIPVY